MELVDWMKKSKLVWVVFLVVVVVGCLVVRSVGETNKYQVEVPMREGIGMSEPTELAAPSAVQDEVLEKAANERMVIQNSSLSLLVKDVRQVGDEIVSYAEKAGGFMVSTVYDQPTESPFATITVRVPTDKFKEALEHYRELAVKVTNENLVGTDVTEEYVDIEGRLETLEKTKAKFEEILEMAVKVEDILRVNREIISIQTQIDYLKGQKEALEKNAELTKITIYLSTDEWSLPYTPDEKFRPKVVFKLAIRSLVSALRIVGEGLIWIGVYGVVWVPVLVIYGVVRKVRRKK